MVRFARPFCLTAFLGAAICTLAFGQRSVAELPAGMEALTLAIPSLDRLRFDAAGGDDAAYQSYQARWHHPDFDLFALVVGPDQPGGRAPGVSAGSRATHCARNQGGEPGEDFIARWRGGREDLERLNADWVYFFDYPPKPALSQRRRCYQASYYRANLGLVHLWLCYDDSDYLHSDWAYILPFRDVAPQ